MSRLCVPLRTWLVPFSCINSAAGSDVLIWSTFSDLRSLSLWEGDENGWFLLEGTWRRADSEDGVRCSCAGSKPVVKAARSPAFTYTVPVTAGLTWPPGCEKTSYFPLGWLNCFVQLTSYLVLSNDVWLHGWGRGDALCIFYFKLTLPTKFPPLPDKEIWIELNQTEVSNNRKWSFFPFTVPLSFKRE